MNKDGDKIVLYSLLMMSLLIIICLVLLLNLTVGSEENLTFIGFLFTTLSSIGTLMAAVGAFVSAKAAKRSSDISAEILKLEENRQIEEKKPRLAILDKDISLIFDTNIKEIVHEVNWHEKYRRGSEEYYMNEAFVEIVNLGNGFAKDIRVEWELYKFQDSVNTFINALKTYKYPGDLQHRRYDSIGITFGDYISNEWSFLVHYSINDLSASGIQPLEYLTLQESNYVVLDKYPTKIEVQIPKAYVTFLNLVFSDKSWANYYNNSPVKTELSLNISYKDIYDREYIERFKLHFLKARYGFEGLNIEKVSFVLKGSKKN